MMAALPSWRRWSPGATDSAAVRAALLMRTAGLPYSVAIDGRGRICGDVAGGLDGAKARTLVARCRARP